MNAVTPGRLAALKDILSRPDVLANPSMDRLRVIWCYHSPEDFHEDVVLEHVLDMLAPFARS